MLNQGTLLNRMTNRIRQSLELQEILDATVVEMRAFLGTDRVKVYRFGSDATGQVIAESVDQKRLPALMGLYFPAGDVPPHAREMYIKGCQRSIIDVPAQRITLSRIDHPPTTGDLTVEDVRNQPIEEIFQRPVDPCHVQYLTNMGVQSSLVVPIMYRQELWGLLASHHAEPKVFSVEQLQMVQMLGDQVSIAISQSHLLSQARERANREALINQISTLLHAPLQIQEILQIVLERVVKTVQGSGGRLYLTSTNGLAKGELYTYGTQPALNEVGSHILLEEYSFWQEMISSEGGAYRKQPDDIDNWMRFVMGAGDDSEFVTVPASALLQPQAIADIYSEPQLLPVLPFFRATPIRSLLVMPLQYGNQPLGCITIFRDEIDSDIIWAGKFDPDERHQPVRNSFEAWRQLKQGQAWEWTSSEIELVRSLATHLTLSVMQNRLYQYEREQRILVEMRNQELNKARTVAEDANRLKSDFLSSTSHELRTPLGSTLNYLKLLKEGFYDNEEELKEYINVAHQSTENLVAIINDVLDIAKIEAGRMNVNLELVSLASMLEEQCDLFKPESRRKHIPLEIDAEIEEVYADKVKLRQILTNLLSNAFKFTHSGKICVQAVAHVTANKHMAKISIIDNGIGIDPAKQNLLFEPFVQEDGSIKRRYGGTGLGLTVCKRLVELMGGEISLDSPGRGQGTTVSFTVPFPGN